MTKNIVPFLRAVRWTGVLALLLPSALSVSPASAATTTTWTVLRNVRGQIVFSGPAISVSFPTPSTATNIGGQTGAGAKLTFHEISAEYRVTAANQSKLSSLSSALNSRLGSVTVRLMRGTACVMKTVYYPITLTSFSLTSAQVSGRSQPADIITFAYSKSRFFNLC